MYSLGIPSNYASRYSHLRVIVWTPDQTCILVILRTTCQLQELLVVQLNHSGGSTTPSTTLQHLQSQPQRDKRPSRTQSQPSQLTVRDFDQTLSYFTAKINRTLPPGIPKVPLVIDNYESLVDESQTVILDAQLDMFSVGNLNDLSKEQLKQF